jgi:hypothetical protein
VRGKIRVANGMALPSLLAALAKADILKRNIRLKSLLNALPEGFQ